MHDLRAPLMKIKTLLDLMRDAKSLEEVRRDFLPLMGKCAEEMEKRLAEVGKKILLLLLLLALPTRVFALESDWKGEISLTGAHRDFPQNGFGPYKNAWESTLLSSLQGRVFLGSGWRLEARPELRGFISRAAGLSPSQAGFATVEGPERLMDLSAKLMRANTAQWFLEAERLNLSYNSDSVEIQIGRKPVGVGTLKVLPVWNKFSKPLPNVAGPNLVFGSDSFTLRAQSGEWSAQLIDIEGKGAKSRDAVHWLEAILYDPEIELHIMGSRWWEKNTLGLALAKDVLGATLRLEALWIGFDEHGTKRELQGGLGIEYALNETWTLLSEALYLENGAEKASQYTILAPPTRFDPLRAKAYLYLQAQASFASFWTSSFAFLANAVDGSFYPMLKLSRSLSDNFDVALDLRGPLGRDGTEFSRKTFSFAGGSYIGAPAQAALELKTAF